MRILPEFTQRLAERLAAIALANIAQEYPQGVHLDGLNLSRAWCWRLVAEGLPGDDGRREVAFAACARHLHAGMDALDNPEFVAAHWLASFAVLALSAASGPDRIDSAAVVH